MLKIINIDDCFDDDDQEDFPEITENELKAMIRELLQDEFKDIKDAADTSL